MSSGDVGVSEDWEKLAGEEGEDVVTGRWRRAWKLGSMGARVGASSLMSKVGSVLRPGDEEQREEALQKAFEKNAARAAEVLGQLKGASMKIGQLMSADPEFLPDEFSSVLTSLQRDAPPMTYLTVKDQIEEALDRPLETIFTTFDPEPLGSASLGQVHRATLEDGSDVAVKVQYPGVAEALDSDLKTVKSALIYARVVASKKRLDSYLQEIRQALNEELDYENEAHNLERFQSILAQRDHVRAPKPYLKWTRQTVLVMEYMEGQKLDEALSEIEQGPRRQEIMERWVSLFSWMFHEKMQLHADPHPGNFLLADDDTLVLLDFGSVKDFEAEFTDGFLDILDACWQDDRNRAVEAMLDVGFGGDDLSADDLDADLLAEYNAIVLEPFLQNEPFDFSTWAPARDGKMFMMRHPSFFRLMPPSDALPYMRVLSGVKGLLSKLNARINVAQPAIETARRRGRLTGEPVIFDR